MGTQNKRQDARFEVEVAAEIYTQESVLAANTRNLSNTGVCVDIDQGLVEGSIVGISLFLTSDGIEDPDVEPLNLKADVIWCSEREDSGFSAGARFKDIEGENSSALVQFLSALG
jgi:PilZ domain